LFKEGVATITINPANSPTSRVIGNTLNYDTGTVFGTAGPAPQEGDFFGQSKGSSQSIDLANLLAPGSPSLAVTLTGTYSFIIQATAAPELESAAASVGFRILNVTTGAALFTLDGKNSVTAPPNDNSIMAMVPFNLPNSVIIPAGGTMKIRIDPLATVAGLAVPEPSSLTLAGIGSLGLLGYTWYRRKRAIA
jgi:hypothetical protein